VVWTDLDSAYLDIFGTHRDRDGRGYLHLAPV
jgi:hypothetical protein